jgi:DNA-binding GntR family transcriptional regulator
MTAGRSQANESATAGYQPMAHAVTERLRQAIIAGEFRPGSAIRQETIAKEMGTSRIPVREALRQLESEGLISIRPHFGARVAVQDYDECMEVYKIRAQLEPLAVVESMDLMTASQVLEVDQLADLIERSVDDSGAWIEADRRFHMACYAATPLPRLRKMTDGYWNSTQQYRRIVLETFTMHDFHVWQAEHRLIAEAVRQRDHVGGHDLVWLHIERARRRLADHPELFGPRPAS